MLQNHKLNRAGFEDKKKSQALVELGFIQAQNMSLFGCFNFNRTAVFSAASAEGAKTSVSSLSVG